MFESLTDRLGDVFDRLRKRGALSEADVTAALREVRVALLEADVALPVVKDFINAVLEKAVGQDVMPLCPFLSDNGVYGATKESSVTLHAGLYQIKQ